MTQLTPTDVPRRTRRSSKRLRFAAPRPALPVRGLWEAASEEEKAKAHRTCVAMLEWWMGRKTREAVASELGQSSLRMWQLSQAALSGMLAGLLRQPRRRGRAAMRAVLDDTSQDLAALRKENAELKRRLAVAERLIVLLRESPIGKAQSLPPAQEAETADGRARAGRKKTARRADASRHDHAAERDVGGSGAG
jgi:hypothetical protein